MRLLQEAKRHNFELQMKAQELKDQVETMTESMDTMQNQLLEVTSGHPEISKKVREVVKSFDFSKKKVYLRLYEDSYRRLQRLEYLRQKAHEADEYGILQVMDTLGDRLDKLVSDKLTTERLEKIQKSAHTQSQREFDLAYLFRDTPSPFLPHATTTRAAMNNHTHSLPKIKPFRFGRQKRDYSPGSLDAADKTLPPIGKHDAGDLPLPPLNRPRSKRTGVGRLVQERQKRQDAVLARTENRSRPLLETQEYFFEIT